LPQFLITPVAVSAIHDKLNKGPGKIGVLIFGVILIIGAIYAGSSLASDLSTVHSPSILPFLLLGLGPRGLVRSAREHNPRAVLRHCRHDGG